MKTIYFIILNAGIMLMLACNPGGDKPGNSVSSDFAAKVIVDFGGEKPMKETNIKISRQLTALEALQFAAVVETHTIGEYVFVSSVDSIRSVRGKKAWYYKVNGESPKVLAINNHLSDGDTLLWIYKADVCSPTVDNN